uniref:RING-type domain-containing protein n=1 Tax=Trieres chinensis TaxID=1514140 RepID=A0A7S2EMV2_TRICV|mmetsp:Transcript_29568/g.60377  ORF Transcript_29568/g.60377 Transcript_29568/m.60377 type:complete len:249 (+) Transcript_29568:64-810(+)
MTNTTTLLRQELRERRNHLLAKEKANDVMSHYNPSNQGGDWDMEKSIISISAMLGIVWLASCIYRRCQAGISEKVEKKRAKERRKLVEKSLRTKIFGSPDHLTDERSDADGPICRGALPPLFRTKLKRKKKIVNSEQSTKSPPSSTNKGMIHSTGSDEDDHMACHICLCEYELGQEVCHSRYDRCNHVFHKHCLLQWLLKHDDCPCCRRNLVDAKNDAAENHLSEDDRAAANLENGFTNDGNADLEAI